MARTGRRPGSSKTREAILGAARRRFGEDGYDATSLRAIAADAAVDPGVILHFFGSKEGLFRDAVGWPFDPARVVPRIVGSGTEGIGARVAQVFFEMWDDPSTRPSLAAVLRSAMTHPASARSLREFVIQQLFTQVIGRLEGPEAELRGELAAAQLIGVAILRYILQIEPLASASTDSLVAHLTPTLSGYLTPGGSVAGTSTPTVDLPSSP